MIGSAGGIQSELRSGPVSLSTDYLQFVTDYIGPCMNGPENLRIGKNMIPQAITDEKSHEYQITLFEKTNIQFLDFDLNIDEETFNSGNAYRKTSYVIDNDGEEKQTRHLIRKVKNLDNDIRYLDLVTMEELENVAVRNYSNEDSLALFENQWFPLPIMKKSGDSGFIQQPLAWARGYISDISDKEIEGKKKPKDGCRRYRLVVAFDTSVSDDQNDDQIITREDLNNGEVYGLCNDYSQLDKFILDSRVREWLFGIFTEREKQEDPNRDKAKIERDANENAAFIAHYVNLITLLNDQNVTVIPQIKVKPAIIQKKDSCIPVQLILDIGNSRTCGVLVENNSLRNKSFLSMRNLTNPVYVYEEPFPSCIEFARTSLVDLPIRGNIFDSNVFAWTSMVRTGFEAEALSCGKSGNEGNTGLSSPKRYLWDDEPAATEWRLNNSLEKYKYLQASSDNLATIAPIISLVNDQFEATFGKVLSFDPNHQKMSAFSPKGSRRSMMTMLLIEILSQAVSQINSYASRKIKEKAEEYRYLDSIILTVPPAMPKQEIRIYEECVHQAIGILWKALKWDKSSDDHNALNDEELRACMWPCFPQIKVDWDEAMCGQICYLYNEIAYNYKGNVKHFLNTVSARNWSRKNEKSVTMATIDIGGGTTDLVINRYEPEDISDKALVPVQMFKESFKIAGDDIVLQIIRLYVVPAIADYAVKLGANKSQAALLLKEKLGGGSSDKVIERSLKRLFTRQVLHPIALAYLSRYEKYSPINAQYENETVTFREIIEEQELKYGADIAPEVFEYIEHDLNKLLGGDRFRVKDVPLEFRLNELHNNFAAGHRLDICEKVFNYISEVINSYICDVVIITGRPSRLPGVATCFKNYLSIPKDRIVSFNQYHFESWYPYINGNGNVEDPKTSAVVGAVLCNLVNRGTLSNFYLKVGNLKIRSSIKYLGQLDTVGEHLLNANLFYKEPLDLDDPKYRIPDDQEISLPPGCMTIGYRQLKQERWPAYPLYQLSIDERVCNWLNSNANYSLSVVFERTENENENSKNRYSDDGIRIKRIRPKSTGELNSTALEDDLGISELSDVVKLRLCTMPNSSIGETTYWLDSGSVMLNV